MGGRLSKAKKSSKEILEDLEKKINELSVKRRQSQQTEKSFIAYLLLLSFTIYLIGLFFFYKYYFPSTGLEWLLYSTPLILFPLVVYFVKKLLNMYFTHRKSQYDLKLQTLSEEKRRVINEVMENEPYRVARELLERFDPNNPQLKTTPARPQHGQRRAPNQTPAQGTEVRHRRQQQTPHPVLMQRPVVMATPQVNRAQPPPPPVAMATPAAGASTNQNAPSAQSQGAVAQEQANMASSQHFIPPGMCLGAAPGPPTPCPILPRDRSNMDKMVEYLVGDGPNNRYALICSQCHSHNGMALRDEFEYLSFRCAYCFNINPARKKKPTLEVVGVADLTHPPPAGGRERMGSTASNKDDEARGGDTKRDVAMETMASGSTLTPARHRHGSKSGRRSESQSSEGGGAADK